MKDPTFKKKLLISPKEAVHEALSKEPKIDLEMINKINISVLQEKEKEMILVLPFIKEDRTILSDKEIENISGGTLWVCGESG